MTVTGVWTRGLGEGKGEGASIALGLSPLVENLAHTLDVIE